MFGNPFRSIAFAPYWRTERTVSVARHVYERVDYGTMAILAAALEGAGCEDADILGHCRGSGAHVRGCWVVDLVLGCHAALATVNPQERNAMRTELYWITGPWPGRLAIMPRPRGGDWLEDEIQSWREAGVDAVVSLLTNEEQTELSLRDEESLCRDHGIEFVSLPIVDRSVPSSAEAFSELVSKLAGRLAQGKNIAVHCRQGIGRAALVAISLLVVSGIAPAAAIDRVSLARGCSVPETPEQRQWIGDFARSLARQRSKK
jgi:protein-tyrosine phosphatase